MLDDPDRDDAHNTAEQKRNNNNLNHSTTQSDISSMPVFPAHLTVFSTRTLENYIWNKITYSENNLTFLLTILNVVHLVLWVFIYNFTMGTHTYQLL